MTPEDERVLKHGARMGIRPRMRALRSRSGWALLILAVPVVLLVGIGLRIAVPWQTSPMQPSDLEAVSELAKGYSARHPSVRGPPEAYRAEARSLEHRAPRAAAERLTRALALDPDDAEAWLHLVVLSCRSQAVQELGPVQARAVAEAVGQARPGSALLPAARAWVLLQANAPGDALALLGDATDRDPADARWARLRAAQQTGGDLAAAAGHLLSADPSNPEACEQASQAALAAGDWFGAQTQADACLHAGVSSSTVRRVKGEVAWLLGEPAVAATEWERAGLGLHAAGARAAEGDLQQASRLWSEALDGPWIPPVAVRGLWLGLQQNDLGLVEQARAALAESGLPDPTVRHAWAAGELSLGNPRVALGVLDGLTDPMSLFLRALATEAPADVDAAFRANPTEPAVAALAARVLGEDAWSRLASKDPLELVLQRRLPSIDEPWQVFSQELPDTPAWLALVGRDGPPPEEGPPLGWWTAAQRSSGRCPPAAPPSALAWCLRSGDRPLAAHLLAAVPAGTTSREILDTLLLSGDNADASLARILAEQPTLAGLARERYERRVLAEERTPTP